MSSEPADAFSLACYADAPLYNERDPLSDLISAQDFSDLLRTEDNSAYFSTMCCQVNLNRTPTNSYLANMLWDNCCRAFSCPVCSSEFKKLKNLLQHIRLGSHKNVRKNLRFENIREETTPTEFKIKDCQVEINKTSMTAQLEKKFRIQGKLRFSCDECSEDFQRLFNLLRHKRNIHNRRKSPLIGNIIYCSQNLNVTN